MSFDLEKLYALLPAVYRLRDIELAERLQTVQDKEQIAQLKAQLSGIADQDGEEARQLIQLLDELQRGPLKALLSVIAEQVAVLEEDLEQLYDDQFIETCAEWVVPYIGDLVGTRSLFVLSNVKKLSQRAQVANTLAYRRRKGTASVLEQLARDVTGWDASIVEYFQLLATTQYLNHLRPENLSVASLRHRHCAGLLERQSAESLAIASERQWRALEYINTPFDRVARTVDVRNIESRRGKYNIPNVGIFLWRLGSYAVTGMPAFKVDDRRYLFDALGKDTPLYNQTETEDEITHLAEPINVPMPISRRVLDRYLDTYYGVDTQQSDAEQRKAKSILLFNQDEKPILPAETSPPAASPPGPQLSDLIEVCDLSDVKDAGGNVVGWAHMPQDQIAIDPELGRIAFPTSQAAPDQVRVTYHYGFSTEMGGGEYGRAETFSEAEITVQVPAQAPTIKQALDQLDALFIADSTLESGVVEIVKNDYYAEPLQIRVPDRRAIELRAADERRPVLLISGDAELRGGSDAELTLNGLVIGSGALRVPLSLNKLRVLRLRHCTLLPGGSPEFKAMGIPARVAAPRLVIAAPNVTVELDRCIVGAVRVVESSRVRISNSIIDAGAETAVAYAAVDGEGAGGPLQVENSTIIGRVRTLEMELASNTIFLASFPGSDTWSDPDLLTGKNAPVLADQLQNGCVRFSYVPPDSHVPRQYHCQPDLALAQRAKDLGLKSARELPPAEQASLQARLTPQFTSLRYGDASYCQLSQRCALEIRQGADDEAEMGAFHQLYQPQREANLRARLDEYLRFGLEAGIFYAS